MELRSNNSDNIANAVTRKQSQQRNEGEMERLESEWLRKLTPPFYTQPVMFLGFSLSGFDLNLIRMDWAKI